MHVILKTTIKQWISMNLENWLCGIFTYTPKMYMEFNCDTITEANKIIQRIPHNLQFSVSIESIKEPINVDKLLHGETDTNDN